MVFLAVFSIAGYPLIQQCLGLRFVYPRNHGDAFTLLWDEPPLMSMLPPLSRYSKASDVVVLPVDNEGGDHLILRSSQTSMVMKPLRYRNGRHPAINII